MSSHADDGKRCAILVYQMGKVGSTTIYESLKRANLPTPLYKVHYLSERGMREGRAFYQGLKRPVAVPYEHTSKMLLEQIRTVPEMQWKIITSVREPIARDVSQFLQLLDLLHPELVKGGELLDISRIVRAIRAQFMIYDESKNYTCRWFDTEIREVFGLDVYNVPFNHKNGFTTITRDNVDVLTLRLEDLDRCFSNSVARFLGLTTPVAMVKASSRSPEKYETAYKETVYGQILDRISLPKGICERVYLSKYAKHFYTSSERERLICKWSSC